MSGKIRMRNSIIKNIDKRDFIDFVDETILEIRYRIDELKIDFIEIKNSTIDLLVESNIIEFTDKLIERNICKTRSESIRFLLFMYILNGKKNVDINLIQAKIGLLKGYN